MNSLMVLASMGMCLLWMTSLIDYQSYQRLTTNALVQSAQDEYLLEGLFVYGQAYYAHHKKLLQLPLTVSLDRPLGGSMNQAVIAFREEGQWVVLTVIVCGISQERTICKNHSLKVSPIKIFER